ncbi:flagellar M-ring protein FliF [Blastococcus sp. TML/M2B]|uniref:flagellar basal-body MS-ring/collar protein FliF n=1 Tax=unclassified Blastococcus TaxID=2619396 RepID=UPI00190DD5A4|nr:MULTISPECIES: flagellar basal-body MS-ring/collar protein FliF [unclassified Blastococcus]MBN1091615.1 flagellar M-ring protein FliF [Blastococcus sp. TML/M2B]MBN1094830.1 flagellar M-ring protein FliF [Blastococcus sp. TML/C7B]
MKSALAGTLERARSAFASVSLGQKVVIGLLLAGLLLGGFFFSTWITAPTKAPLFSNLATSDAAAIVEELNAAGVTYELTDGGQTILVAKDAVYDLRLQMSGKGLPSGSDTGYALLDEQGITSSEFQQQVTYKRAIEGELSRTLEALDGVNQAIVSVALPKDEVFVTEQAEPTAAVLLDLAPGTTLSGEQIQAVTNLVSASVESMAPDQVTVTDTTGQVLSSPGTGITAAAGDARSQVELEYQNRLAANAQRILDTVLGPNRSVVSVRADVDLDKRDTTSKTFTYDEGTPPVSERRDVEEYSGSGGAIVGGVLGPENMPDAADNTGGGDSSYTKESTTSNNAVGETTEVVQGAPGGLNRLTVSVVMDQAVAGNLPQAQLQALVGNAVGLDEARGDAITVAAMPFDTAAADAAAADMEAAREAEAAAAMWSMIRTGGIAAGIALLVLVVWLRSRKRGDVEEDYEPLELSDDMLAELDRIRIESTREAPVIDNRAAELEAAERQRVRSDISTMITERPDEVAAMLRGWLTENKA